MAAYDVGPSAVWFGAGQDAAKISDEPLPRGLTLGPNLAHHVNLRIALCRHYRRLTATSGRELSVRWTAISQPVAALPIWVCGGSRHHSAMYGPAVRCKRELPRATNVRAASMY